MLSCWLRRAITSERLQVLCGTGAAEEVHLGQHRMSIAGRSDGLANFVTRAADHRSGGGLTNA